MVMIRAAAALTLLATASCGTILDGGPFLVPVRSDPPGATVRYRNHVVGTTPCVVKMYGRDVRLKLSKEGYSERTITVEWGLNWWGAIGNGLLLIGMPVGLVVDFSTGCWRVVEEHPTYCTLRRGG